MCSEPDFGVKYRQMIAAYRLAPEALRDQLAGIFQRLAPENPGCGPKQTEKRTVD